MSLYSRPLKTISVSYNIEMVLELNSHISACLVILTVQQWEKVIEEKLMPLFNLKEVLSEEEAVKMGRKDPDEEVEKFISANTQELGKDKWLCPLSGKKFKVDARWKEIRC